MVLFVATPPTVTAYSGVSAADYAEDHAYDSHDFPNDCTNFVSKALQAGGWKETGKYKAYSMDSWYYDFRPRPGYSNTWTVADSLYRFMSRHQERAVARSAKGPFYNYKPGDVLQIDYERDGEWDHTMIVIKVSDDGNDLQIAQHGDGKSIRWFNGIKGQYSGANFIGWSIR